MSGAELRRERGQLQGTWGQPQQTTQMTRGVGGGKQSLTCTVKDALGGYGAGRRRQKEEEEEQVPALDEGDWN